MNHYNSDFDFDSMREGVISTNSWNWNSFSLPRPQVTWEIIGDYDEELKQKKLCLNVVDKFRKNMNKNKRRRHIFRTKMVTKDLPNDITEHISELY